ncbi:hypothetical protein SDC9_87478 [bioreactor metagenome]|uniref:Uncharacterized protein n=1 Tax=bioreactor metagenome TaxID=1076179 RepID=A0A644ZIX4_9ZZZZ
MKNLKSEKNLVTVIINKSKISKEMTLKGFTNKYKNPSVLYSNRNSKIKDNVVNIDSEDTLVILWN